MTVPTTRPPAAARLVLPSARCPSCRAEPFYPAGRGRRWTISPYMISTSIAMIVTDQTG